MTFLFDSKETMHYTSFATVNNQSFSTSVSPRFSHATPSTGGFFR